MTSDTINASTLSSLANDLAALSHAAGALQKKIDALLPRMGSDAWWDKEIEQGANSLKVRPGTVISSKEELKKFLML